MLLQKDLEDRIKALEQFVEGKKNDYLMAMGRLEEQKELLGLMVVQEKKLLADAAEAEKKAAEEASVKGVQDALPVEAPKVEAAPEVVPIPQA